MFSLFRKKEKPFQLEDLEGHALKPGDKVLSLRYDLGECVIVGKEQSIEYESLKTGEFVHYAKMIDAASGRQKVRKISG